MVVGKLIKKIAISLVLVCLCQPSLMAKTLTATVDSDPVMVGETFTLTITSDTKVDSNQLDTSALLRDFVVGATSVGSNTRVVNGSMSQQTTWNVRLSTTSAGTYNIPSFTVDNAKSAALTVTVIDQPRSGNTTTDKQDVRLVTRFDHTSAYVGQQLLYQVKLYIAAPLQRAQLQAPSMNGGEVTPLGEDTNSSEILDGRRYRVITRHYNIRPTQSGRFELKGSVFRGDISLSQRTSFFNNGRSKPVTLIADSQSFDVLPIPDNFPGQWLVSNHVVLQDDWSKTDEYRVGEPITRTLTLTVADATQEQLPDIEATYPASLKTYPDKKTTQQGLDKTTLIAQSVQKIAIIPNKVGTFDIPAVRLPWFNAKTRQVDWATLPSKTVTIGAGETTLPQVMPPQIDKQAANTPQDAQTLAPHTLQSTTNLWLWQSACAALFVMLIGALSHIYRLRNNAPVEKITEHSTTNELTQRLEQVIKQHNVSQIGLLFPLWLKEMHHIDVSGLVLVNPELAALYQDLVQTRYGKLDKTVDFDLLLALFKKFSNNKTQQHDKLDGLYS